MLQTNHQNKCQMFAKSISAKQMSSTLMFLYVTTWCIVRFKFCHNTYAYGVVRFRQQNHLVRVIKTSWFGFKIPVLVAINMTEEALMFHQKYHIFCSWRVRSPKNDPLVSHVKMLKRLVPLSNTSNGSTLTNAEMLTQTEVTSLAALLPIKPCPSPPPPSMKVRS